MTSGAPFLVFLDKDGGSYTMGTENSTTNTSSIISANVTLPATTVDAGEWTAMLACVQSKFSAFNVTITDVDPGTTTHVEVVMIDHGAQINQQQGVLSISPFNCNLELNVIPFVMWGDMTAADRCWTIAQTIGNTVGLDHELSCPDLMTFQTGCGSGDAKTFTDAAQPCGESAARMCCDNTAKQNSFAKAMANLGPSCK